MVMDFLETKDGMLYIDGVSAQDLCEKYGTPLFVYSEKAIISAIEHYKNSINEYYNGNGMVLYASKAFSCKEIYRIAAAEGIGVDCVSAGEIFTALSAGFPAEKIFFHGNNKTEDELRYALKNNVGHVVADNFYELDMLDRIAGEFGVTVKTLLRITPGIDAHTHDFIKTGKIDSKFGFAIATGDAMKAAETAASKQNLSLIGFHCHIGSQIFETEPFVEAARVMMKFISDVKSKTGACISELNLGGGFGIKYTEDDHPLEYTAFLREVSKEIKALAKAYSVDMPAVFIEPGRSIVAPAGLTLYRIGGVKEIKDVRSYVSVDGGMCDNPRYALYGSKYTFLVANRMDEPADYIATIAGKCCESGDLLAENVKIAHPNQGDILAVLATGAYNYSMASNYNRIPRPAAVMVKDGSGRVIIRRESYEDLIKNDV